MGLLKNPTFFSPSSSAALLPLHIRGPLISTPMKLFSASTCQFENERIEIFKIHRLPVSPDLLKDFLSRLNYIITLLIILKLVEFSSPHIIGL